MPFLQGCSLEYSKSNTGADKKTGLKFSKVNCRMRSLCTPANEWQQWDLGNQHREITISALQGDLRFVMTVKGSRILLSVASAAEELQPVIAAASDFDLLSFKVLRQHRHA